ncbi:RHS repeat-associated core domain-containing protein, partial [Neisseria sp. HMSC067G11]
RYNAGNELVEQREFGDDASLAAKLMAQLGGQPVPKKDAASLSDGLDGQAPLRTTEFKRDILGRLIHTLARNNDKVQETVYQYDLDGNLVRAANRHSITCFDYNGNGQIIGQHQWKVPAKEENAQNGLPETDWRDAQYDMLYLPVTESIRYHYDFNGNRTATVLPDGRQINYLYYGSGHLHQISLDDEVISDIERDKLHREIYRTQGKLASRYELDPLGRLKRQIAALNELTQTETAKNAVTSAYAVKRSYGYNRTGNLTHSTDQRTGTTHFEYDKLGRITKAGNEVFAFDPAHNILSDLNSLTVPDNRLKTYNGTTYYYDELGNLIHRELADGEVQNYFYDLHDQLVKAEIFKKDGTKETWAYTYDALGRRIGKGRLKNEEVSETSFPHDLGGNGLENQTRFVWDGSHLLQEVHPDGRYTYLYTDPDSYEPLAQVCNWTNEDGESKQQTHYFHCDQIGIPREMTDKDGNLLWFGNYTGWGRLKEETKVTYNAYQPFRLQNQYADRETGLHYNFFRYYEPDAGRFVNQDPIGLAGGSNLYWALQNSQMWADPLGLSSKKSPGTCNDPCAGQDPAGEAAGWQGSKDYPGVDNWKNVVLEKGTILFTLYPHGPAGMASAPGNYFVRGYAVRSARGNARAFNDSVQVRHSGNANAARDMRKQLHIFVVEEDICVGKSKAKANKKYGDGGATQYYIRDIDKPKLTSTGKLRSFRR